MCLLGLEARHTVSQRFIEIYLCGMKRNTKRAGDLIPETTEEILSMLVSELGCLT